MTNLVKVCAVEDLQTNMGVGALVKGEQIALFQLANGDVFALSNFDPFSEANVLSRGIVGDLKGHKVVASPIYKHHYKLDSGECLEDETVKVPAYQVVVKEGAVFVAVA